MKKGIHWPSLMWLVLAIVFIVNFFITGDYSNIYSILGCFCLAYASLRLVPRNLFTQKISFSRLFSRKIKVESWLGDSRRIDAILTYLGLIFLLLGVLF